MTTGTQEADFFQGLQKKQFKIGDKEIHIETGRLARAASGAVRLQCEETVILVTATVSEKPRPGIDFFPLLVDYEEKMYSVGRLPGGYMKREGRPSDKAILSSRLIDRPIRPLFPDGYRNDVQIVATTMSTESVHPTDVLAILGASFALELSGAPFEGPLGAVRVSRLNGQWILNPTFTQVDESDIDLVVSGTEDSIMMVEAGTKFVSEADLIEAIELAHAEIRKQVQVQKEFTQQCGAGKKPFTPVDKSIVYNFVESLLKADVVKAYHDFNRESRQSILASAKETLKAAIAAQPEDGELRTFIASSELDYVGDAFKKLEKVVMRTILMEEGVRADGRKPEEIRPIFCQVGVLPRVHGSALFTRGNTQVCSVATLGAPGEVQKLDGVDPATERRWMHHYSFPGRALHCTCSSG
jgi:polyribonucleotide nucleotidyltransferase